MKSYDRLDETTELSRRGVLSLAAGAALLGERAAIAQPSPGSFVDRLAIQQIADRDPALRPPLLVDMQTHVWWRANGPRTLTDRGGSVFSEPWQARARQSSGAQCRSPIWA